MRKLVASLVVVFTLLSILVSPVVASGGQARGEKGQGFVNQVQIMNPPPFEP